MQDEHNASFNSNKSMGISAEGIIALLSANLQNIILSQHISVKKFASTEIKNTRHSSGYGLNAKNISGLQPDECPDESSGTHQAVTF